MNELQALQANHASTVRYLLWIGRRHAGALHLRSVRAFWRKLTTERLLDRWSGLNAAVNAMYLALGERRTTERISEFEVCDKIQT